jgi:hypothetical protein
MIVRIFAALLGSGMGAGVRAGVAVVEQQIGTAEPAEGPVVVSGSLVAAVVSGIVCTVLGRGPRTAFWFGAVLTAAGADRLDGWVLQRFGVDRDRLVAQARAAAAATAARRRGQEPEAASS